MNYNAITNVDKIQENFARNAEHVKKETEIIKQSVLEAVEKNGGKILLQLLKDLSLWDKADENINKDILAYHRGRRDIWLIIRQYLPKDILAEIEIYDKYKIRIEER